jgi:type IV secretory pathway ATPase VirB11/archaellum biosynthesis ATPase
MKKNPIKIRARTPIITIAMRGGKNTTWHVSARYIDVLFTTATAESSQFVPSLILLNAQIMNITLSPARPHSAYAVYCNVFVL